MTGSGPIDADQLAEMLAIDPSEITEAVTGLLAGYRPGWGITDDFLGCTEDEVLSFLTTSIRHAPTSRALYEWWKANQ